MKFYIVEDDVAVIKMLSNIIEDHEFGSVCGYSKNGVADISEILVLKPDVVLVDLLMPEKDGIETVNELRTKGCAAKFIMISQVSSKAMIAKAYNAGVDFYINKPINIIEVKAIINKVLKELDNEKTLNSIKSMFAPQGTVIEHNSTSDSHHQQKIKKIQYIINKLGMSGEKGAKDIVKICEYMLSKNMDFTTINVNELCGELSDNPKTMEQRIRRAISKGLSNIAAIGLEDYMNDVFTMYSSSLFNFEDVKIEMDFVRGKRNYGGKINVKKFIDGLIILVEH